MIKKAELGHRVFDWVLGIFLIILPIVFVPFNNGILNGWVGKFQFYQLGFFNAGDTASISFLFMELSILVLFALSLFIQPVRRFNDYYAGILFSLCLLGMLIYPIGLKVFSTIVLVALFYYIVYTRVYSYKTILYPIVVVASINTLVALLQSVGIHWFHNVYVNEIGNRIDGLMKLSSHLGFFQAVATPLCYSINPWFALIPLLGLALSGAYVPLIATLIGMLYLMSRKYFLMALPFLGFYSVIGLYLFLNWKILLYKLGIRLVVWREIDFSWFGHSLREFSLNIPLIGNANTIYSLPLTIYYYLGVVGLIAFLCMITRICFNYYTSKELFLKRCFFSSFIIILLCGLSQSIIDCSRLLIPAMSVMMLLNIMLTKESEVSNGSN